MTDSELAAEIARTAGRLLIALRESDLFQGAALGSAGDRLANAFILAAVAEHRPDYAILSEESADTPDRLDRERVWIIDPLDGTREYSEGRDDWAVHIALAVGGEPSVGAVALPGRGLVLRSDQPAPPPSRDRGPIRIAVSRTRPPAEARLMAERLGAELVPMGSAGAKTAAVLLGEADAYVHAGGQHEWDNCAPAAVALAWGFHVSRLGGEPLTYNRPDISSPDFLVCSSKFAAELTGAAKRSEEDGLP